MSERSESTYPESTAGPTSPIFGTASFSTFTTTALTSLWPPSTRRNSRSGSSCGSENQESESGTYQDDQSVAETEEGGIRLVADEVSNLDDNYEDEEEEEEENSEVSAGRNSQFSTDDTLSASYHIQTTSGEYTTTTPTRSSLHSYDESSTPVYSNPYLTSSSEQLVGTLSRTTLTPTYTGTPITHSRSYTTSSLSGRPTYSQASPQKRTAGELIAFYEQQAHSRAASAPMETGFSRPGSPTKPGSQSYSVPVGMPGALAAPRHTHDARSWRSGGSGKTLSSWSFESDRSRSPVKSTSDTGSAPSGSVISGTSGYTRSGSTRSGYAGGLMSAIGGLVGFSSSSATSSRALSTSSRSPSRRTRSPPTTPRRKERTASSPRSAFSQIRRSPKGKARERDSPRSSPSPTRSRARSSRSGTESVQDAPSVHSTIPPPLDVAEYGGSGEPVNSAPVWYLNVHRLPPYTWNYAEGYLFPNMLLLSWVAPGGGRVVVKLDLLSCVEIRTSRAQGASDVTVEREGETHRLQTFELGYGDSIERLGCETRVEMLDWFNSIQSVFNGIMSMTESERAHGRPASPAQTISSFDFGSGSDSVLSAQLRSAPVSGNPSQSYRSREYRPQTPTVPLAEGVLRGSTPPIDTTVSRWRSLALEDSSDTSSAIEDAPPPQPALAQPTIPVTVPTLSTTSHSQLTHSHSQFSQPHQLSSRYAPSTTSHSQTITQSLSSGTLYNGARTIMEIGSSTGTDIVASTLSFRGTASASLLGDSCAPTTIETASTVTDRYHRRVVGPGAAQSTSASGYGYIAELDEPQPYDAAFASPAPRSNVSEDVQQGQGASGGGQDQVGGSPAEQSDSDYVTAASPTASFVSLSGMSAFPDDDEEEEVIEPPSLPDPMPEEATPEVERPPTPSEVEVETVKPDDLASTVAPIEIEAESTVDDQSKDSDVSTPIVAPLEPEEPVQAVEVSGEPEPEPELEITPPPPPVLRVDASTQADVEPEPAPEVEEPVKDDTPQPELVPLPAPADTVYTPSVVSVGISPIPLAEPELVPGSPQSDVLSTLSGAVPELSQLPTSAEDTAVEVEADTQSLSSGSLGIVAGTPMPSLTSDSLSDSLPTPEPAKRSPSVVESVWPAETDRSYESSVLNASPSLTIARTSTEYIGVAESPAISDIKTPASLLKAQTEVLSVAEEDEVDAMTFDASDVDSADDASTPTASSWVSSLPPSVPSNTLNETESVPHEPSEVEQVHEVDLASSIEELSTVAEVSSHPKVFAEEACQADFVIEHPPLSPRLIPLPISRPPSRHSVSIAAVAEKVDGGSSMDSDDVLADRFAELEHNLTSSYSLGSDKIIDQLAGMGQALNKDHIELRNMLIEILENTRPELREEVSAKSASAVSTVATVSQKVDAATSPILVAMVECSTSPPPVLLKEQAVSPVLLSKYRDMDAGVSHRSRQSVNTIMLTPPPRDAATPDTLMETMSYLSSHHSDDISEIDLELSQDPLQVDRVSPSWASDSSADSEELSEDEHSEAQEDEDGLESALGSPAQMSSLSMAREDGSVVEEDHLSGIATEVPGEGQRAVSSIAAGTLLRLPAAEAVTSDVVSLYHSESASGLSAIQMPVPTRAGLPFGGQLASLMTPEEKHVDQGVSAGYSDIGASYIHQATSPVHEAEPASSPSLAATFLDKEIDSTQPEPLDPLREDKSVATFPDEDRQEQSIDTDLTQGREEKLVDAIPDSVYEEKLVDAIPDSVYEDKLVDAIPDSVYEEKGVDTEPEAREEEAVDTTPEDIQEEKSVDVDAVLETHEEKAVDTELEAHEEKAVDTTPEDIHEEKSVDALLVDGEDKEVDALPPAGEDKGVDALPPAGEDKGVDALPPAGEDKEIDALAPAGEDKEIDALAPAGEDKEISTHFTGETEETGTNTPLATTLDDKSVDALPALVLEEKAVDTTAEVTSDPTAYAEKDCDTADLVDASAITLDDVAAPPAVDLPKTVTQDAEVQAADLTKMLVPPFSMLSDVDQSVAPPTVALPTFLQDQPTFSAHMKDIVSSGLSPALENVALLVYENRMARDEFKKANEDYESMVRDEFRKAHDDYRQTHEESIVQIKEMYRMAQDEMMNSLAQMKDLVSQLMSQKPVSVSVSVPQQHSYPIPPGFVPNANSEQAVYQQPMMYPAPPIGSYSQPISQQPIFMPTPDVNGVPSPVPAYLYREGPVVPSPPPLSPTLSESSGTSSSSATPTLASMHILQTGYAVEPSTVARGAMVPLPPSPISLSPQPLHLPFTSQTDTRDLPVVPEMPAAESPYMMLQPSLTGVGHASEYYAGHVEPMEPSEASSISHGTDTPSETPILPMQEADAPAVIPEPVEPEPVAEPEPQSESSVEPVEPVTEEPSAENDDTPMTSDVAATHAPTVVEDAEDNESDTSQSDMSGLTTPPRPSTPADALTRDIDLSAAESQEPSPEDPSDDSPVVPDLPEESKAGPNLDMDAAEVQPVAPHALAHEIEASIAAAASDLKSVVEAARGATEGALAASKEAQSMLESVRAQREEVARELEECTREREAAKADRDEAEALREQAIAQAAADREQGVAERDARIEELQQELGVIKAKEIELETSQANAVSERDTRIQTLEEELGTVRSELEEQKEARAKEQAERGAQDEEREKAHAEANAEHDARIAALEEELASLRASQEEERQAHANQDEQHQKALEEATSEREREVGERDSRIQALEQELETMRSEHDEAEKRREAEQAERDEAMAERERTFTEAAAERDARIESLESDLTALREETEREREEHRSAIAKLEEAQQASEGAHTEAIAEHQRQIEERDQRVSALEEELSRLRSDHEAELLQRAAEVEALTATWTEQEKALNDASAERDERIKALEDQLTEVRAEHEQIQQNRDLQDTERHAAWDEREQALQEAAADRDSRISALEEELSSLRAEREQEKQQLAEEQAARVQRERDLAEEALERERLSSERQDNRIKELTDEIAALRAEREQERQQRETEDAERREAERAEARELAESQTVKLTGIQEKLEQLAEQSTERFGTVDTRLEKIAEESTEKLAGIDTKLEKMAEESIEKFAGVDARLEKMSEDSTEKFSGVDARFATVDTRFDKLMEEATERSSGLDSKLDKLAEESIERSSALNSKLDKITEESIERSSTLDSKFDKLAEESLERTSALDSKLDKITEESVERSNALDSKLDKITEESIERSNALDSKLDKITEESVERSNALDSKLDKLTESSTEQFTSFDSKIDKLAEVSTEQFQNVETRFAAVEQLSTERFTTLDSQLEKMNETSTEKFAAVEGQLAKIDEEAVKARDLHEQEMAEAAAKPTVEALFEQHIGVLKAQVQEQMDALQNELKIDGSRQHEEIMANVRATIEEQSAMLVTTCLDELGKLLESIGAQQQAEILSAMRVTIQEQVTFNISYYLDELTKMFDAHGVRSLAETIEAVRATAREQVPYNTEGHLTDFCKNLAPEMLQLFQEIKEKAEEKSRLDRQIDILRRHKHDYEAGDLRGDEYTDAIPVPPPQQIHVTRSDADLHKAWRGRRPTRRDENPTEIPYSQTGSRSHHSIYPDQWSHNSYDSQGGEVVLLPPQDDPMMPPRSPNASFYHQ